MNAEITIKKATEKDAGTIAVLGRVTFGETFKNIFTNPDNLIPYYEKTFSEPKIRSSFRKNNAVYWLVYMNDVPVGYAKLKLRCDDDYSLSPTTCQLQKIYILKDHLKQKIGQKLLSVILKEAVSLKNNKIWLSVEVRNERAIHFYIKNGFLKTGNHTFSIGTDDFDFFVMSKQLKL